MMHVYKRLIHCGTVVLWRLGAILSILAFTACAFQKDQYAGSVNGVKIPKQEFINSLRGHFASFQLEKERVPDENEKVEINRKTWRDITIHVILMKYFHDFQIQVSQQEVVDTLLNNVPLYIKNAPVFQTNGSFNKGLYSQSILNNTPQDMTFLKNHYFKYYVPLAKLKAELRASKFIRQSEVKELTNLMNSAADIDWIFFKADKQQVKVSQAETEAWYQSHLSDFEINPYASFGYLAFPVAGSEADRAKAKTRIDSVYNDIKNGIPFEKIAEACSMSSTAANGGSTGFVQASSLPPTVQNAINPLNKGEYTKPILLKDMWAIYQLVDKTKAYVKLNEIVIRVVPDSDTIEKAKLDVIDIRDLGLQLGLNKAATETSHQYRKSGVVTKQDNWYPDPEICAYLIDRAYTLKSPAILEPVYSKQLSTWILAEVIDVQPYKHKPLLSVNDSITILLEKNKRETYALTYAQNWIAQNRQQPLIAAKAQQLDIVSTSGLKITDRIGQTEVNTYFTDILRDYNTKKQPKPLSINGQVMLPIVSKVTPVTPAALNEIQVRDYYFEHVNPGWFDQWLENEIAKARKEIWFKYP